MLQNISRVLPLIIISITVTSCSATKPQAQTSYTAKAKTAVEKQPQKLQNIPVVYEKRSPKKHVAPKQRQYQQPRRIVRNNQLSNSFNSKLSNAALGRLKSNVRYDGAYAKIAYPGGDVAPNVGVCTDVVIRSYRKLGIDLQEQVHLDMNAAFDTYPNHWGLTKPDSNIDHRRVYNLRNFFQRRGAALPISHDSRNYKPGDVVSWMVGGTLPHMGVVVNQRSKADPNRFMIVHNIARGPQMEDILFAFPITGHYRYTPAQMGNIPSGAILTQKSKRSNNPGMTQAQLIQAANLLGTNTNNVVQATRSSVHFNKSTSRSLDPTLLDQVVTLNSTGTSIRPNNSSLSLANLSDNDIERLLIK